MVPNSDMKCACPEKITTAPEITDTSRCSCKMMLKIALFKRRLK
jgi:hypothetical protein